MALNSSSSNDHAVNRVAVCSAIFAGFAYVGYSVAKNAFGRRLGRKHDDGYHDDHRLYFRRLSQTTQTDVLLGNLDNSDTSRVFLRPMTVQERIKELNLRARMFADTMIAIQTPSNKHSLYGPRSLQASPWNSPRIMSPVDAHHILGSRSTENLRLCDNSTLDSYLGTPVRKKNSSRSLRRKSPQPSEHRLSLSQPNQDMEDFEKINQPSLLNRPMEINEAKNLLKLMGSRNVQVLEKVLVTVSNLATFTPNQEVMREAGYLSQLQQLIYHPEESVQITALVALGNLALNKNNAKEMKETIPVLLALMKMMESDEIIYNCLSALTNIAVFHIWHSELQPAIHALYSLLESKNPKVVLQCLKLLINLSCNDNMIPHLLGGQAPKKLSSMLSLNENEDILLRLVTLFSNLTDAVKAMELDPVLDLPIEDKAAAPETMYANIYGVNVVEKIRAKSLVLMKQHKNEEIRMRAQKIYNALAE
ncbi:uncharacterized protein LOC126897702 isoform X2 [Daktulosphaira vitifoliae]|uniref:uncharacterized protein LOC126897702 isoform X2 n=1 Tax=Daktulosphaira vitifoliae TaxID=58002 RepID=UPI0021A9AA56|nr:uncharacterized protein LOC126897702 isoform X2 [Daktulosphaira vitifoliae]